MFYLTPLLSCLAFACAATGLPTEVDEYSVSLLQISMTQHLRPVVTQAIADMQARPSDQNVQLMGCLALSTVSSADKSEQDAAGAAGGVDAATSAMLQFPDDKAVFKTCLYALQSMIMFNRRNGLRAGQLGALNITITNYRKWFSDPEIMTIGGCIGSFFDYVNENRAIARELGGIHLLIQNIKNNFHGIYSDWAAEPVRQSLYGLSSGCWTNEDICFNEDLPELGIQLMMEHGDVVKIAEETMQANKAMMAVPVPNDAYRKFFAQRGLAKALVHVMNVSSHDQGAVDLACDNMYEFIGPRSEWTIAGYLMRKAFDPTIQALATREGAVEQILSLLLGREGMQQYAHGAFNFDIDASYNVDRDCVRALASLAYDNEVNKITMLQAGIVDHIGARIRETSTTTSGPDTKKAGCYALDVLSLSASASASASQQALFAKAGVATLCA